MKCSRADFHIVGLLNDTPLRTPEGLQPENQVLKGQYFRFFSGCHEYFPNNLDAGRVYLDSGLKCIGRYYLKCGYMKVM
jgi:hypothetical protein